ncbi:lytic polysaccharide monooxygenase [Streptomyces sp. NPDC005805]|uniref:lytic polysaccharide monooxygenase n=1 Tax=Streptomyces sp. NPDC005805 TaxID=3157068 RepID=UPI0033F953B4
MKHRAAAVLAATAAVPVLLLAPAAGPAAAHGAPTDPVSRAAACGAGGPALRATAACRAAVNANGGVEFRAWDNIRVAGVAGRDRRVIPDGQLCSAGLDAYRGLDLARRDWPATPLEAGGELTMAYRSTIPHRGTFAVHITRPGYDPRTPLRWSDLVARPLATVRDPALVRGAYRFGVRLPEGLTGRHVLYTIWRNSDTPDTYYSCSDVILTPGDGDAPGGDGPGAGAPSRPAEPPASAEPPPVPLPSPGPSESEPAAAPTPEPPGDGEAAAPPVGNAAAPAPRPAPASAGREIDDSVGIVAGGVAGALALAALCAAVLLRRREA